MSSHTGFYHQSHLSQEYFPDVVLQPEQCHEPPLGLGLLQQEKESIQAEQAEQVAKDALRDTSAEVSLCVSHLPGDGLELDQLSGDGLGLL